MVIDHLERPTGFGSQAQLREMLERLEASVTVEQTAISIKFSTLRLAHMLGLVGASEADAALVSLHIPAKLKRRGHELRLVHAGQLEPARRDEKLVQLLASAHEARRRLLNETGSLSKVEKGHLTRLTRLSYLAPDIVMRILEGHQPVELTARSLLRIAELPTDWRAQRQLLDFT